MDLKRPLRSMAALVLSAALLVPQLAAPAHAAENRFSDVSETDWFYPYVMDLSEKKVINGYPDGTFQPQNTVTAGEALALIVTAAGNDAKKPTDTHWASGYASFAVTRGYIAQEDVEDLDRPMTRLEIARLAAKALILAPSENPTPFADCDDGYVTILQEWGILSGNEIDGLFYFKPGDSIQRSEISAILYQMSVTNVHPHEIKYGWGYVPILDSVPVNSYDPTAFYKQGYQMHYSDPNRPYMVGVDVSKFQGEIDWQAVKDSGIEFAILRIGGSYLQSGDIYDDVLFEENYQGAREAGLLVGVYFFSAAVNAEEANREADYVLGRLAGRPLDLPVVWDWEDLGNNSYRNTGLATEALVPAAHTFCGRVREAGYEPMIYFNNLAGYRRYDLSQVLDYQFWYARYTDYPDFYYDFDMWQYSSKGRVPGIEGDVDMNIYFLEPYSSEPPEEELPPEELPEDELPDEMIEEDLP